MLLRFRCQNFRSLRDEQELSLVASSLTGPTDPINEDRLSGTGVLSSLAIYGANASGKTNVFKAIHYMVTAIRNSHNKWEPAEGVHQQPFLLSKEKDQPSTFEMDFEVSGVRYQYGFVINSDRILEEWLYAYPDGHKQMWFSRSDKFSFGKKLTGENRAIEKLTRPNSLFLSAAAQNNHELLSPLYTWLTSSFIFIRGDRTNWREFTARAAENPEMKAIIASLLCRADLGLSGFELKEDPQKKELTEKVRDAIKSVVPDFHAQGRTFSIQLLHKSSLEPVKFSESDESQGTLTFFSLLGPIVVTVRKGAILIVDELDASLHPLLAKEILSIFNSKWNQTGAQFIFNTHDTNLLDSELLRRDQVWFAEKDESGASHIYPLSDFKPRRSENLQRGYLQGRFGAIPFLGDLPRAWDENQSTENVVTVQ